MTDLFLGDDDLSFTGDLLSLLLLPKGDGDDLLPLEPDLSLLLSPSLLLDDDGDCLLCAGERESLLLGGGDRCRGDRDRLLGDIQGARGDRLRGDSDRRETFGLRGDELRLLGDKLFFCLPLGERCRGDRERCRGDRDRFLDNLSSDEIESFLSGEEGAWLLNKEEQPFCDDSLSFLVFLVVFFFESFPSSSLLVLL